jgi:hypothetical protein
MEIILKNVSIKAESFAELAQQITPMLEKAVPAANPAESAKPATAEQKQVQDIIQENLACKQKLTSMEKELANLKVYLNDLVSKIAKQNAERPVQQVPPPIQQVQQNISQAKANGSKPTNGDEPDEQKAEKWARENIHEWLDEPCRFVKAGGRTWRQLAGNVGDKIAMNGKGEQSPRAYLHAIEGWKACKICSRVKAKVALHVVSNGCSHNHYSHPEEIGY